MNPITVQIVRTVWIQTVNNKLWVAHTQLGYRTSPYALSANDQEQIWFDLTGLLY